MNKKNPVRVAAAAALACAMLDAGAVDFHMSGFASAVVGRTTGPCSEAFLATDYQGSCTRFVADWGHAGVYKDSWSASPESRAGIQATARVNAQLSATAQVVARAVDRGAELEWAYVTWAPTPSITVQAGRKRLPLFFYSDFQDVGYAYPWVRVPPDVYGWDIVNYNGANVAYSGTYGSWALRSSVFGGVEDSRKNRYMKLYYDEGKDIRWPRIAGADLELTRDWLTVRVVYMRSGYEQRDRNTGELDLQSSGDATGTHAAYGGSVNVDSGNWALRSEYSVFDRSHYAYKVKAWFLSAGYRIGSFTPTVMASDYRETSRFRDVYEPSSWSSKSFTLRYDFGSSSALKLQVERLRDRANNFPGSATVVSASYDVVF